MYICSPRTFVVHVYTVSCHTSPLPLPRIKYTVSCHTSLLPLPRIKCTVSCHTSLLPLPRIKCTVNCHTSPLPLPRITCTVNCHTSPLPLPRITCTGLSLVKASRSLTPGTELRPAKNSSWESHRPRTMRALIAVHVHIILGKWGGGKDVFVSVYNYYT